MHQNVLMTMLLKFRPVKTDVHDLKIRNNTKLGITQKVKSGEE